jgi:hypothetical protein
MERSSNFSDSLAQLLTFIAHQVVTTVMVPALSRVGDLVGVRPLHFHPMHEAVLINECNDTASMAYSWITPLRLTWKCLARCRNVRPFLAKDLASVPNNIPLAVTSTWLSLGQCYSVDHMPIWPTFVPLSRSSNEFLFLYFRSSPLLRKFCLADTGASLI